MGKTYKGSQVNSQFDRRKRRVTKKEQRAIEYVTQLPNQWQRDFQPIVIQ